MKINETLEFNVIARVVRKNSIVSYYTYGHYKTKDEANKAAEHAVKDLGFERSLRFTADDGEQNTVWHCNRMVKDVGAVSLEVAIISNRLTLEA